MTLPDQLGTGQAQVLAAIIRRAGCGPVTLRQLRDDTGLALTTVHRHVRALDAEGLVSYVPGKAGTYGPMVAIGTPEQARLSRQREYDGVQQMSGPGDACNVPGPAHSPSRERTTR